MLRDYQGSHGSRGCTVPIVYEQAALIYLFHRQPISHESMGIATVNDK